MPRDVFEGGSDVFGGGGGGGTPPKIGTTLAELGPGSAVGDQAVARIGTYPDIHQEEFIWDGTRWVGMREHVMMMQADTWGMDLGNRSLASIRNAWARITNDLPYGVNRPRTTFGSALTLPSATIATNTADLAAAGFTASGSLRIRDQVVTYTGLSAGSFTGCTGGTGTFPANTTLIVQGYQGGYGTMIIPMDNVSAMWSAGFRLQEQVSVWLNGSFDGITMSVAPYYYSRPAGGSSFNVPPDTNPTGGLGFGLTVTGPTDDFSTDRALERGFAWHSTSWTDWVASAPTDRFLYAGLYGRMNNAAANDHGEEYGYCLRLRWIGP